MSFGTEEFKRSIIRERTRAGLDAAKAMLADASFTVEDLAKRLGVSPATLYRHLPATRAQVNVGDTGVS